MHDDERYFFDALDAGASGYVLKRAADTDLIDAIRAVARGEQFVSPTPSAPRSRSGSAAAARSGSTIRSRRASSRWSS